MKARVFTLLFLFCCGSITAQFPLVKQWDKRFGGIEDDYLASPLMQSRDGEYFLGASSFSGISGDKTQSSRGSLDYWMVKTDSFGNKLWDKRFGGTAYDELCALQQTTDGGYIFGGLSFSDNNGDRTQPTRGGGDYWVVKIDSIGNKLWDRRFGGADNDYLTSMLQTPDGGYMLSGNSKSGAGGDKTEPSRGAFDYWIVKIDSAGNKQWDKSFGGTDEDYAAPIQLTRDKGYIIGGHSRSGIGGDKTQDNWDNTYTTDDYWVVKTDSLGNKQWDRRFGGVNMDWLIPMMPTTDGGYILRGFSYSGIGGDKTQGNYDITLNTSDIWVVKIDSLGNKQWDKRYGGTGEENGQGNILETPDGGYLIAGASFSPIGGDKSENNLGIQQTWIVKTDNLGNKQWDKTIFTTGNDGAGAIVPIQGGCYAIANVTSAGIGGYKTQPNWDVTNTNADCWIIKFCDTSLCNLSTANVTTNTPIICATDSAQICAPPGSASYLWNNGATTSCIYTSLAGNYYVTVTDNSGCSAESNHLAITVLPLPPVAISVNGDTLSVYDAVTQQWYLNGSAINNATSNIYIATQGGSYTVAVTDTNGCLATSSAVIISGIDNLTEEDVVSVYPNPLNFGFWILECGSNYLGSIAEVFDANGRVVFKSEVRNQKSEIRLNAERGVYLLLISSAKSSVVRKLIRL